MFGKKKMVLLSSGPITPSATEPRQLRSRSAKSRSVRTPHSFNMGRVSPPLDPADKNEIIITATPSNSLSFDNWLNQEDVEKPCLNLESSNIDKPTDSDENNADNSGEVHSSSENIEIRDIEDTIESGLVLTDGFIRRKLKGTPITLEMARQLRIFLFRSTTSFFGEGWLNQGFEFNPPKSALSYGLRQKKGGPCGLLACVQAYILKVLLNKSRKNVTMDNKAQQKEILTKALALILTKIIGPQRNKIFLVTPGERLYFSGIGNYYKSDGVSEKLEIHEINATSLKISLNANIDAFFENDNGVVCFLYSVILTKGIHNIKKEMDNDECSFIGNHGYCSQEMINLLLTGRAVSNTFDNTTTLGEDMILYGVESRSEIGFLSLFEHYGTTTVGSNLKFPIYPIWVICSESHFSVLFSIRNPQELYYYDELARQEAPIRLTLIPTLDEIKTTPPLEKCILTKWKNVRIDWNGTDPIL